MGGKRTKRVRLATGVFSDPWGVSVIVRGKEHRYPLGTPIEQLRRDRRELVDAAGATPSRRGTLAAGIAAYLETVPDEGRRRKDKATLLQHWLDAGLGPLAMDGVQPIDLRKQMATWSGFAPQTRVALRQALSAVYNAVNGRTGYNPVRDVPRPRVRYDEPRGISYDLIEQLFTYMPDRGSPVKGGHVPTVSLTKLRLKVMAYTGLTPAMLKRVEPRDFDPKAKTLFVRPRQKGQGVDAATLPLLDDGVAALKALAKAGAFGTFNTRSVSYVWGGAVTKMRQAWESDQATKRTPKPWPLPENVRPYDLRHSFGTLILATTGDLEATANLMRHSTLQQTRRYAQAASALRAARAVAAVNTRVRAR